MTMVMRVGVIVLLVLLSSMHPGGGRAAASLNLSVNEQTWLDEHPKMRLAIDVDWAPFEFVDEDGLYRGMAAEYIRLVEQRLGVSFAVDTQKNWQQMVEAVKNRELDIFSCVVRTADREQYVLFTRPYLSFPMVIITLDDEPFIDGLQQLEKMNERVAVVESYASHDLLRNNHPGLQLTPVANVQAGLEAVLLGKIYSFVGNLAVVSRVMREKGITNLKVSGQTPYRFDLAMAVRSDWPELLPVLQKALDDIGPEEQDAIYDRWIRVQYDEKLNYRFIVTIIGGALLVVTVILFWNRRLRSEIDVRKALEVRLKENSESLARAQEIAHLGNWDWEIATGRLFWSDEIYRIFGHDPNEFNPSYEAFQEAIHPDDRQMVSDAIEEFLSDPQKSYVIEHRIVRPDGQVRVVREIGEVNRSVSGEPVIMRGTVQDITESKAIEESLILSDLVIEHASESVFVTDRMNRIIDVNPAYEKTTGYSKEEVLGKNPSIHKSGRHGPEFYKEMWSSISTNGCWAGEIWDRRKSGEVYPTWLTINTIKGGQGGVKHYVGIFTDISRQKSTEEALEKLAFYDPLTKLPNRALFRDRLGQELKAALRNNTSVALFFIDLDRFKYVNDTFGHDMGDELLVEVALRIESCVRKSDTVSRLGGDEFTVIMPKAGALTAIGRVAAHIIEWLNEPFTLRENEVYIGASIGIALYPDDGQDYEALTKNADLAMYQAKEEGRGQYRFFSEEMNTRNARKHALEVDLRYALSSDQLMLDYQPKLNLQGNTILGMEALIRWNHPKRGVLQPSEFIPLAEDTGLIVAMGEWVMREACCQTKSWLDKLGAELRVAVNLSAKQFRDPELPKKVAKILGETGLSPNNLEFEITESTIMNDPALAAETMLTIRDMGIHISIDDFGTGYSSLSYLKRFPLHSLKIDRSFIRDMTVDSDDARIIEAIISMANALGLEVVAEGVETEEQLRILRENRCTVVQGYYFSKPLAPEHFFAYLAQSRTEGKDLDN